MRHEHIVLRDVCGVVRLAVVLDVDLGVVIPAGFTSDGASIPRPLWPLLGSPFDPAFVYAAVLHDWLYYIHSITRVTADILFRQQLIRDGVPLWKARLFYAAVRMFGAGYWVNTITDELRLNALRDRIELDGGDPRKYGWES